MSWFSDLTGFEEPTHHPHTTIHTHIKLTGDGTSTAKLSFPNGQERQAGRLDLMSLSQLRALTGDLSAGRGQRSTLRERVGDVGQLHSEPTSHNALFQVASQFNLLEMISPNITPERGITGYIHDRTQGPTCALAAAAGTIYRNYFVQLQGPRGPQRGQTADAQINCICELGVALGNQGDSLWEMRNGYLMPTGEGLREIYQRLTTMSEGERDHLRGLLRVGVQWDTEVTRADAPQGQRVQQAYCSALPITYAGGSPALWEPFARLVLEATYEHTLRSAALNLRERGARTVYLTAVGGGVFGNDHAWINDAIIRALKQVEGAGLDVVCVSYGGSSEHTRALISAWGTL